MDSINQPVRKLLDPTTLPDLTKMHKCEKLTMMFKTDNL